ncbi:hypothetical protein Rsub_01819 [Raphidocelis subcapitata]|uniref:Uncharacterized protein n=1 Tax=Raphidocelis subcapitata TaxID=307507 RepID=A0A2V0NR43_9CHLO|nr:hypothetical protein Rsub_01819 [Raphidocelis subcapitata]|eukprot:GBF89102.1 hypothetical protein Rsub_01819 [Raphidocelis subcapitata]
MAAPPPAAAEARAALRALLRAIDRHFTSVAGNAAWRDHAVAQFRAPAPADAAAAWEGLRLAKDYARLVQGVAHHRDLLLSYNLGLDSDERNKRMVEATARRVGFAMPNEPKPPPRPRKAAAGEAQQQQGAQQQQEGAQQQQQGVQEQQEGQAQRGDADGREPQRAAAG